MHKKGERKPLSLRGKIRNTVRFGLTSVTGLRGAWRKRDIVKCLSRTVLSMGSLISDFLKRAVGYMLRCCISLDVLGRKSWCYCHSSEEYSQNVCLGRWAVVVKWTRRPRACIHQAPSGGGIQGEEDRFAGQGAGERLRSVERSAEGRLEGQSLCEGL